MEMTNILMIISTTDTLITGPLTNDTTFYLSGVTADLDSLMPLPPHGSVFTGNVRGYYFTAPADFLITGLRVPTEASTGSQNIEILRFDNQTPPPLFSGTTNAFTSLGYWNNYTGPDTIEVCIAVTAGDVIGIYGNRADANSYAGAPYQSMIAGIPTTLTRSGMQLPLSSNQMSNVFSEAAGSISRVEMFYDVTPSPSPVIDPINVTVPTSYNGSVNSTLCQGDSVYLQGAYQSTAGTYYDTLFSIYGCDSITANTVSMAPIYDLTNTTNLCVGDSIFVGGAYQTAAGIFVDYLQATSGCDSTVTTILNMAQLPTVTFIGDTMCTQSGSVPLAGGSPAGGVYSGTNVSANNFDAATAGAGTYTVVYTYTDTVGCINTANADVTVLDCASIGENTLSGVSVYPNPATTQLFVSLPEHLSGVNTALFDASGKLINTWAVNSSTFEISLDGLSKGMYVLEVQAGEEMARYKLIKE